MNKKIIPASLAALILIIFNVQAVLAHETVTVGDYEIEIGWVTEPPIAGQQNAIVVNVSKGEDEPVEDVADLTVSVSYGGQEKTLTLQPLGEDTPGQYVAPILPAIPGQYTVKLGGKLGDTAVDTSVDPEEVQAADSIAFPSAAASSQAGSGFGLTGWLALLGVLLGLVGTGFGWSALRKSR